MTDLSAIPDDQLADMIQYRMEREAEQHDKLNALRDEMYRRTQAAYAKVRQQV